MGKRYVCIWFRYLETDWISLRKPGLKNIPFVITQPVHGRLVITAANASAEKKGVFAGMVLADARAIIPSLQAFDHRPGLKEQLLQRIAEWCIRFTPFAAVQLPDGIVLDATGCTHLWGGEAAYLTDIVKRLKDRGYTARISMADTVGAAWAVARFARLSGVVPQGKHVEALLSFPPAALRLENEITERLHKLGLRQIKNFISIPRASLRRRFGEQIIQRINQAVGVEEEVLQPVYPVETYQERLPCLEPIARLEGIQIALQQLLEALCLRLKKESKGLRTAYFRGYRIDNGAQGIEISTSKPSNNIEHLFHLFSLKLSTMEPAGGFELFVLEAIKVEDCAAAQSQFWKEDSSLNDTQLAELIDRVESKLGADAIVRYLPDEHWWPERSIKKAQSIDEPPATEWRKDRRRPLYLLASPQSIEVTAPIPDYPPLLFRYKNKVHKIVKADGPERIEKEWWIEEGEHRDYYCVEDEEGCRYWVFRAGHYDSGKKGQWWLHGFFA